MRLKVISKPTSEIGMFIEFGLVFGHRVVALADLLNCFAGCLSQIKRDKPLGECIFELPPITIVGKFSIT
jgi:hypothetical protein